jgi:cytochrome c peroxidase
MRARTLAVAAILLVAAAARAADRTPPSPTLGLPDVPVPTENPQSAEKIALGQQLFWDGRLSKSGKTSCFTCHQPTKGWADGQKLSRRDDGTMNTRHTPTLLNVAFAPTYYWDGRAPTLEKNVAAAWRGQMGLKDDAGATEIAGRIREIAGYAEQFRKVFNEAPTPDNIAKALASYLRTLLSGNSRYDRFEAGDAKAYTPAQARGAELFKTKAKCSLCHAGAMLTAYEFKNIGVGMDRPEPDPGRGKIDPSNPAMKGAFRVPTMRNVAKHPPYMHDGSLPTLDAVVAHFAKPPDSPQLDEKIRGGVQLTPAEKRDLIAFIKALDGSEPDGKKPQLPK